ncbi:MAG: tetratricopeptide repeat protein [Deltaproteobacteria bacterium]|nr:tetratricopeptide repeat protein [Deltaproteobacteria bacterium]
MIRIKFVSFFILVIAFLILGCASDEEKKQAHFSKGNAYFEKGEYKSARLEYKNAIQIDPKYKQAHQKLGETNLKLGDAQGAFRAFSIVALPSWIRKIWMPS